MGGEDERGGGGAEVDKDGIDGTILCRGKLGVMRSPRLDIQVKAHRGPKVDDDPFSEVLEIKSYDDLRDPTYQVPRILVVVHVPVEIGEWCVHSEDELLLRRCGYWRSLRGLPATTNATKVTVKIPRSNRFDVAGLTRLMTLVAEGAPP